MVNTLYRNPEALRKLTEPVDTALLPELQVPTMGVTLCIESYTIS